MFVYMVNRPAEKMLQHSVGSNFFETKWGNVNNSQLFYGGFHFIDLTFY